MLELPVQHTAAVALMTMAELGTTPTMLEEAAGVPITTAEIVVPIASLEALREWASASCKSRVTFEKASPIRLRSGA